jgi:hypothetical protein
MSLNKKIFFISLTLFCIALLLFGIYNLAFKSPAKEIPIAEKKIPETIVPKVTPKTSNASIAAISDEAVLAPTLIKDTNVIKYYTKNGGRVYQIDFDGNNKINLSARDLIGINKVTWSPDKTKVITKFVNADKTTFSYYNYAESKNTLLKDNFNEIVWHNSSNRIFYIYSDPTTKKKDTKHLQPRWHQLDQVSGYCIC